MKVILAFLTIATILLVPASSQSNSAAPPVKSAAVNPTAAAATNAAKSAAVNPPPAAATKAEESAAVNPPPAAATNPEASAAMNPPAEAATNPLSVDKAEETAPGEFQFPIFRTLGGIGLVFCLMIALYFIARKYAPQYFTKNVSEKNMKVIETLAMGEKRSISIIQVADSRFLVGNTPNQITLLASLAGSISLISDSPVAQTKSVVAQANPETATESATKRSFRNLFEVEKNRPSQYTGNTIPDDVRAKMRQLREALEK